MKKLINEVDEYVELRLVFFNKKDFFQPVHLSTLTV